jgi:thiol-disulfide isomerase/thioredoxin
VVASSVEAGSEESILSKPKVNDSSYLNFHSAQMFTDGLSFSGFERNKVFIGRGDGSFADLSSLSGADSPNDSRGAVWVDFDDDGDADVFVHNLQRERHDLYRNDMVQPGSESAGFLKVQLRATTGQYEAIGATVTVSGPFGKTAQVMTRGAGFNSCQPPELIFGLATGKTADVEVIWPGGARQLFSGIAANSRVTLVEGEDAPEAFAAHPRPLADPKPPGLKVDSGALLGKLHFANAEGGSAIVDPAELAQDGKPIYVNLWASYCPGCIAELPLLAKLAKSGDAHVVMLSMDSPGQIPAAEKMLDRQDAPFTRLYLPAKPVKAAAGEVVSDDLFDLERLAIPTTLVLNAEGRVETVIRGPIQDD